MSEFKSWRDIKEWLEDNNYDALARRMQMNDDCWNSSGEFERSQVAICDALRFAESEEERREIAEELTRGDDLIQMGLV